jgi:hypothetical protein
MSDKIVYGLIWSLGGLVVGYVLCWIVTESALRTMEEQRSVDIRGYRLDAFRVIVGIFILLMVVFSSVRYYQATSCQTTYNEAVAESLKQRSEAQGEQAAAQIKLLTTETGGDPTRWIASRNEYIAALQKLERVRAENPLPASPDCGGF